MFFQETILNTKKVTIKKILADDNEKDTQRWEEKFQINKEVTLLMIFLPLEERIAEPKKSLRTHLMEQILLDIPEGLERKVAILILDLIEPSGWIKL